MRLTLHLTRAQRVRLEQAAALVGQALNDFILDHAVAAADAAPWPQAGAAYTDVQDTGEGAWL